VGKFPHALAEGPSGRGLSGTNGRRPRGIGTFGDRGVPSAGQAIVRGHDVALVRAISKHCCSRLML